MITFSEVSKEFHGRTVLDRVSFQIQPAEFVCLSGPSGAGKSTIVQLLIRLIVPTTGTIEIDGANLALLPLPILQWYRRKTGVLFQDHKLFSGRTVAENIAAPLEIADVSDKKILQRVKELLCKLGLTDRRNAFPQELSEGEKTRTAFARAIALRPDILIADEPTGNLDPDQSREIMRLLQETHEEGTTVILASHDPKIVEGLNTRVLSIEHGKILRDVPSTQSSFLANQSEDNAAMPTMSSLPNTVESTALPVTINQQEYPSGKIKPIAI